VVLHSTVNHVFIPLVSALTRIVVFKEASAAGQEVTFVSVYGMVDACVVFSSSSAKANYYLVAVMPVAAMQLAFMVENKINAASRKVLIPGIVLIAFYSIAIWWLLTASHEGMDGLSIAGFAASSFALFSVIGLLIAALVSMTVAFRVARVGAFAYLLLPILSLPLLLQTLVALDDVNSARSTIHFYRKITRLPRCIYSCI